MGWDGGTAVNLEFHLYHRSIISWVSHINVIPIIMRINLQQMLHDIPYEFRHPNYWYTHASNKKITFQIIQFCSTLAFSNSMPNRLRVSERELKVLPAAARVTGA